MTARGARELLDNGDVSSVELTQAYLERIDGIEPSVKSFVTVTPELALEQAREADERIASGNASPLTGIPMQLKDNMATKEWLRRVHQDARRVCPAVRCSRYHQVV